MHTCSGNDAESRRLPRTAEVQWIPIRGPEVARLHYIHDFRLSAARSTIQAHGREWQLACLGDRADGLVRVYFLLHRICYHSTSHHTFLSFSSVTSHISGWEGLLLTMVTCSFSNYSPGRYYAAAVMKTMLAQVILKYDCELVDKKAARWFTWRSSMLPRKNTMVMFRPRQAKESC